jgi:hypothetical protein
MDDDTCGGIGLRSQARSPRASHVKLSNKQLNLRERIKEVNKDSKAAFKLLRR